MIETNENCVICHKPSDYGVHGVKGDKITHKYYCKKHYHKEVKYVTRKGNSRPSTDKRTD